MLMFASGNAPLLDLRRGAFRRQCPAALCWSYWVTDSLCELWLYQDFNISLSFCYTLEDV